MHRPRGILIVAVVATALLASAGPTAVAATPAQDPSTGSTAAPPAPAEDCDLVPLDAPDEEFAGCMRVTARLSKPPSVGQTAALTVTVEAQADRKGTKVTVALPPELAFVDPGAGAATGTALSADGTERTTTSITTVDLAAGDSVTQAVKVRAVSAGGAIIRATALSEQSSTFVDSAADELPITIAPAGQTSVTGLAGGPGQGDGATVPAPKPRVAPGPALRPPTAVDPVSPPPPDLSGARVITVCATGQWVYTHPDGSTRGNRNHEIQLWDNDFGAGDDFLGAVISSPDDGTYTVCADNTDADQGGLIDVYVRFVSQNSRWRLQDTEAGNNVAAFTSFTVNDANANVNYGQLQPSDNAQMRGQHAFDTANIIWQPVHGGGNNCWDPFDAVGTCRQVRINWTSGSTSPTDYDWNNAIRLPADAPDSEHTVIHELAHFLMDDIYDDFRPATPNCSPHSVTGISSAGCAWVEGYAEWLPALLLGDKLYRFPGGGFVDLENHTWNSSGWANGDTTEGRIAGALIDISDFENEGPWDRFGEGFLGNNYSVFTTNSSNTFSEFFNTDRANAGFDMGVNVRSTVYQSSIDYSFRDPMPDNVGLIRPVPTPHNYSFATTANFWTGVGLRPNSDDDELFLFDDFNQTSQLAISAFGGTTIDYVLVDGNRLPEGDYYPRVTIPFGSASYTTELSQLNITQGDGIGLIPVPATEVINIFDSFHFAEETVYYRAVPSPGVDPELLLHNSTGGLNVQSRESADVASTSGGFGTAESFSYKDLASQWNALVLTTRGTGSIALYRDTTAPVGTFFLDNGAAKTKDRVVALGTYASDSNTGIYQMRISTDGALDSEPWVPYAATSNVTLPTGNGTKTVRFQMRNNALMATPVLTDTIVLDNRPNLVVSTIGNPPANRNRGQSMAVTDRTTNNGATASPANTTYYALSLNTTFGSGDVGLGTRSVPALASNAGHTSSSTRTIPSSMATGSYYLLACADPLGGLAEYSEADNCRASGTKVQIS